MNNFNKVGNLQQRDLELQKKLAKINNIAVKKLMTKEPPLPVVPLSKDKNPSIQKNTPQAISDLSMRDLAFRVKLDDMTDQALDVQPFKVVRAITQEMIDDYQAAPLVPIEIGGVNFKYNPSKRALDLGQPKLPHPLLQYRDVQDLKNKAASFEYDLMQQGDFLKEDIQNVLIRKQELKNKYTEDTSKLENILRKIEVKATRAKLDKLTEKYSIELVAVDNELEFLNNALKNVEDELRRLSQRVEEITREIEENEAEIRRVNDANKAAIYNYEQDLKALNPNLNISQNIGESDAEYAERLKMVSNTEVSQEELTEAVDRKNYLEAKKNIGKLIKSGPQADVIVKFLSPEERFNFNKLAPIIIKDFLEIYGFDNKRLTDTEIIDFIRQSVNDPNALIVSKKLGPAPPAPVSSLAAAPPPSPVSSIATGPAYKRLEVFALSKGLRVKGMNIPEKLEAIFRSGTLVPEDIINDLGNRAHQDQAIQNNRNILAGQTAAATTATPVVGVGIKSYPKLVKFGKIYISGDDLYYKNILKIRNANQKAIIGFTNKKVSDTLASTLLKIIDGDKITKSNLSLLNDKERQIYDKLMLLSGLHKTHDNTFDKTAHELKETIATIRGEIEAGNNNPELLREAHTVLWNMAAIGMLNGNTAKKYYNELKSFF